MNDEKIKQVEDKPTNDIKQIKIDTDYKILKKSKSLNKHWVKLTPSTANLKKQR